MLIDNSLNVDVSNNLAGEDRNQIIIMQSMVIKIHPVMSKRPLYTDCFAGTFQSKGCTQVCLVLVFSRMMLAKFKRVFNTHKKKIFSFLSYCHKPNSPSTR